MKMRSLAWLGLLPLPGAAADLPETVLPAGVGVNIHFTRGHEKDLDLLAEAGFKFIRMDFTWAGTERKKGEYGWAAYEDLTGNLEKRGLRALYILDYSNPLYEDTVESKNPITGKEHKDTASPQKPESVAAFARWAAAAARHFKGRRIIWEIWNEPNISFWKPKPDVQQYTALALATCKAVREADPQATIIAPASSGFPWEFLEAFLKSGVLEYLDAVSVHPYRAKTKPPETAAEEYKKLRALIERCALTEAKRKIPIISGEWGYSSHSKGVSLETQAQFIARQQLVNLLHGVPLSIWYDWKNDGPNPNENEHNFGTVTPDLKPKPAYLAIQTLTRELSGCRFVRRLSAGNDLDYLLLLEDSRGQQRLAAWTLADSHRVSLQVVSSDQQEVSAVDGLGATSTLRIENQRLGVALGGQPIYVALGSARVP
jgi:beta-xylosidase